MKICISTDAWTPIWGGGQKHIWEISSRLVRDQDCHIDILIPNLAKQGESYPRMEEYANKNLRLIRLGRKFIFPNLMGRLLFLGSCLKWILTHNYDIVHSHAYQVILFPIIKMLKPKQKLVYTVHGAGVDMMGGGILNRLNLPQTIWKLLLYSFPFDLLISVAKSTIKHKTSAKNFEIVPNGVDVEEFDSVASTQNPKKFKIIWVGRIDDPVKGIKFLKSAFEEVKKNHSNVELALINNKYGVDLIKEYKSSDLFVLPSLSEGLPLTLLEAMAAKLPVVVTAVGDCGQLVKSANCGLVVHPGDFESLFSAINDLINNANLRKLGFNGYNFIKAGYNWEDITQRQYELYKKISPK